MNEPGEPYTGKPSVRFDEGRCREDELTTAVGSIVPSRHCLLYPGEREKKASP